MTELDRKLTFESFVVGPANRLAAAAARRAAESPGTSYNPLFVYSASGLGKSHILSAVAQQARKGNEDLSVLYQALEGYLGDLADALEAGTRDQLRERYRELDLLLMDDVQFLAGQSEAQEMLLSTLDALSGSGSQIILASDRPPAEIDGLDARLVSRFSGGLIVDIGPPEYETRVAIIRRKSEEEGHSLQPGVAEAVARYPFRNVRELGGALNRILAIQDLEERAVTPDEVPGLIGENVVEVEEERASDDFGSFLDEVAADLADAVEHQEEEWRKATRDMAEAAEREGFSADRLRKLLQDDEEPEGWQGVLDGFKADVVRLREIEKELDELDNPWPEAAQGVIQDPERVEEAEALLGSVRERQRPFRVVGAGPELGALAGRVPQLALKAAQQLVTSDRPKYNPLFLWSEEVHGPDALLAAAARAFRAERPEARTAVTSVLDFAEDFIRALSGGVAGAWRERWWTVDLLLVHGAEALSDTERAQDEFFHLFEALKRRGSRVLLTADRPPSGIAGIDERLRSRFEGGLVLEVEDASVSAEEADLTLVEPGTVVDAAVVGDGEVEEDGLVIPPLDQLDMGEGRGGLILEKEQPVDSGVARTPEPTASVPSPVEPSPPASGAEEDWRPSREKVVWRWPDLEERLMEELG